ncbi:outer membrane beta-barrel protein [Oceanobacter mangrovi]|uniref:outer membrane beta-barrel protein n=1 Tax=Oceanobacter mangrovi TaxID=2862510 RepID=UPI001C8D5D7A|nr:outer membrane beta-barrel protein [Oceanobacter mangrovi]
MKFSPTSAAHMAAITTLISLAAFTSPLANAVEWDGSINLLLGSKQLDSDDWPGMDQQGSMLLTFDIRPAASPVALAADLMFSAEEKGDITAGTAELHLGPRWYIDNSSAFTPYLGAGVVAVNVLIENDDDDIADKEDSGNGWWAGAGVRYQFDEHFQAVLDVRYSDATVTIDDNERQAGGSNFAIGAGYRW